MKSEKGPQENLFEEEATRSLLDQLLADSRLYKESTDFKALLDFTVRLRNFAPFNAMLLQVQKPGLYYAASASDWWHRFRRTVKEGARPLLILWPFGPVALVYDLMDTEGVPVPIDTAAFYAAGVIDTAAIARFVRLVERKGITWTWLDAGDRRAGSASVSRSSESGEILSSQVSVNRNHEANVQFSTLAHELGHLFLGHLGFSKKLKIPARSGMTETQCELEAESVAYIVCARNGVECRSKTYLATYVQKNTTVADIDVYQVMRAAGQIETLLDLAAHTKYVTQPEAAPTLFCPTASNRLEIG